MSGAGHTPGPWEVEDPLGNGAGDALWIVQAGLQSYQWNALAVVCSDDEAEVDVNPIGPVERDANARLISAAPDLLTVAEEIDAAASGGSDTVTLLIELRRIAAGARLAIAKARGQS